MNDKADTMDDIKHTKRIANTGIQLNIPVGNLNIPEDKLGTMKNVRNSSKNPGEQDDKKCSPLEKSNPVTRNDNLKAYRESDRDNNPEKCKERK